MGAAQEDGGDAAFNNRQREQTPRIAGRSAARLNCSVPGAVGEFPLWCASAAFDACSLLSVVVEMPPPRGSARGL